jgi:hypothetical protein
MIQVLASGHGSKGGVAAGEQFSVAAVGLPFMRCVVPEREAKRFCQGESLARVFPGRGGDVIAHRPLLAVIPFLNASQWLFLVLLRAPGENPRYFDRAAATFLRRAFLEDAALEHVACCSLKVARRLFF